MTGYTTVVQQLPTCDVCKSQFNETEARFDGRLGVRADGGPWGYACFQHFLDLEMKLGVGRGQLLILPKEDPVEVLLVLMGIRK